jgi:hypothetical protein
MSSLLFDVRSLAMASFQRGGVCLIATEHYEKINPVSNLNRCRQRALETLRRRLQQDWLAEKFTFWLKSSHDTLLKNK